MVVAGDIDNFLWEKRKMKKHLSVVLFGIVAFSFTGCYTQIAMQENDDSYVYNEPISITIYYPVPDLILLPIPPEQAPPHNPIQPIKKIRKSVPLPSKDRIRDDLRNSGGRNQGGKRSR